MIENDKNELYDIVYQLNFVSFALRCYFIGVISQV